MWEATEKFEYTMGEVVVKKDNEEKDLGSVILHCFKMMHK